MISVTQVPKRQEAAKDRKDAVAAFDVNETRVDSCLGLEFLRRRRRRLSEEEEVGAAVTSVSQSVIPEHRFDFCLVY